MKFKWIKINLKLMMEKKMTRMKTMKKKISNQKWIKIQKNNLKKILKNNLKNSQRNILKVIKSLLRILIHLDQKHQDREKFSQIKS